ncbi:MAG TPA: hypothetical protein VMZ53_14850 [Kofleriaceae bacterium]|nr:hypothetical protein [Kofleriaceae bacterium]
MRLALLLVAVTGCGRIGFDTPGDGNNDSQASLALTCNKPVRLVQPAELVYPRLAGIATQQRIGAAWIEKSDAIVSGGAAFETDELLANPGTTVFTPGSVGYTAVSLASNGPTFIGAGAINDATVFRLYDSASLQPIAPDLTDSTVIQNPHAITSVDAASGKSYAFVGSDPAGNVNLYGISATNQISGGVVIGFQDSYIGITTMGARFTIAIVSTDSGQCELASVAVDFGDTGPLIPFGGAECVQPTMAYAPGRSDFLLLTYDTALDTILQRITTISGSTLTPGAPTDFGGGTQPRAVATPSGYWATYHVASTVRAKHLSFAGVEDFDVFLGAAPDDTSHDLVTRKGEAYALWMSDALYVAHLCAN